MVTESSILDRGTLSFTIESRIIRELGERLVKEPEVALLELVKNAYDADAQVCTIEHAYPNHVSVRDDGHGMTLTDFKNGWMRIGTSSKETNSYTRTYERVITGEKGIGRFAVRYLGHMLRLETVAVDSRLGRTHLSADFDWPEFDKNEDVGKVQIPYVLRKANDSDLDGTLLFVTKLRPTAETIDLRAVKTAAMTVVTPYHALLRAPRKLLQGTQARDGRDPGFALKFAGEGSGDDDGDVAEEVLKNYVHRAVIETKDGRVTLKIFSRNGVKPVLHITDTIKNLIGQFYGDIRFFPKRTGTFRGLGVDGRRAKTWVKDHSGIAVFDRTFRVYPYGAPGDDWLKLSADTAKNIREPRSSLAKKHLQMDDQTRQSTQLNYMLRLPYPEQLVGLLQVQGQRTRQQREEAAGLIPAADREGFLRNAAFEQLFDLARGAVEAIAYVDREQQVKEKEAERLELIRGLRKEAKRAAKEIEANPNISREVKTSLLNTLSYTQRAAELHEEISKEREASLEIMSLLGVVAGFMTHEFGAAIDDLEKALQRLERLAKRDSSFKEDVELLEKRISSLKDFVTYSQGYIQGASHRPDKPFTVKPRIQQVVRVFGKYAKERGISVSIDVDPDVVAPLVPVSLYNGIALNFFTNALKAVTAKTGNGNREIAFRAWNENSVHFLEVSDTGIGIPDALKARVFDPLFTTTSSNRDPLGSGMGLGLTLVKRGAEAFKGRVDVVDPPPEFSTCFRLKLPFTD